MRDATAPGCHCEGWGVSARGITGYANDGSGFREPHGNLGWSFGTGGLTAVSFVTDDAGWCIGSSATRHDCDATDDYGLTGFGSRAIDRRTSLHHRHGERRRLFEDQVKITNDTGATWTMFATCA